MPSRATSVILLVTLICALASADSWRRRTPAEKVADAELIVYGVATLEGLPLQSTEHPVQRSCRVVVLQTLWPTNTPVTNAIVVQRGAWTKWPDTWWNYNSQTGIYFFERTATQLKKIRAHIKKRDPGGLLKVPDNALGTNVWAPLDRMDDWYEPATNTTAVEELMTRSKK
jgi:hypothetical protein